MACSAAAVIAAVVVLTQTLRLIVESVGVALALALGILCFAAAAFTQDGHQLSDTVRLWNSGTVGLWLLACVLFMCGVNACVLYTERCARECGLEKENSDQETVADLDDQCSNVVAAASDASRDTVVVPDHT